jgi:hypothetical protein
MYVMNAVQVGIHAPASSIVHAARYATVVVTGKFAQMDRERRRSSRQVETSGGLLLTTLVEVQIFGIF